MMHQAGSFEAETRLAELLRLAERGDEVVVLRRGQRVAIIMGAARYDRVTQAVKSDWRKETRDWLADGNGISRSAFRKVLSEARQGRP